MITATDSDPTADLTDDDVRRLFDEVNGPNFSAIGGAAWARHWLRVTTSDPNVLAHRDACAAVARLRAERATKGTP